MIDLLIPGDSTQDDTIQHKNTRRLADQQTENANDREFTQDEVRQTIESFNPPESVKSGRNYKRNLNCYFSKHTANDNRDV